MELWIPYGETEVPVRVPDDNFYRVLEPAKPASPVSVTDLLTAALDNPIGDVSLARVVKPSTSVGIVVDPMIPAETLREVVALLKARLASLGVSTVRVFVRKRYSVSSTSDASNGSIVLDPLVGPFTDVGKTGHGTNVSLNQQLLSCEVKIGVTSVRPHFATGFTGGPEMIIPTSCSEDTITKNRSLMLKGSPDPAKLDNNQVLSDSLEACKMAGPFYSVCLVPDGTGGIDSAFAGELEPVFRQGVERHFQLHSPKIERRPDIVLVSAGRLSGVDLYHAVRILSNVSNIMKKDGTIILVAECDKGVGNSNFLDYARNFRERKELAAELRYRFKLGGHVNMFLFDMLDKHRIELVSVLPDLYVHDTFQLKACRTASEAVQKAIRAQGKESKILTINRADHTIPVLETA
ncbi:MAG TPA: lactate racemase domain-containing protein [Candidatus Bathyarchaeia archaeon]|nr:lactate racemase domain-containing protein [Candidatus Bathyarchaeia archaeon]